MITFHFLFWYCFSDYYTRVASAIIIWRGN